MGFFGRLWRIPVCLALLGFVAAGPSRANPALVVDVDSGAVLYETMATAPWYPASLTKLMTTYVALSAAREGRISLDTPLMVSPRAAAMAPSKMGFRPGTLVTLDNALKMLMVKSPNDIAVTIAEGVGGSVEGFAEEMNQYGARLGLHESHFVNPNGLPDPAHFSSARDMAMIGRALLREFPEQHDLFGIGDLAFGGRLIRNHNNLLGRYPGVDGMKTGYTCSAGYNVVLSAERGGRRLITVVMGSPSVATRSERAASLFNQFFSGDSGSLGQLASLPAGQESEPPDLRSTICGRGRANAIAEAEAETDERASRPPPAAAPAFHGKTAAFEQANTAPATIGPNIMQVPRAAFVPVRVFIGPVDGYTGPIARPKDMPTGPTEVASAPPLRGSTQGTTPTGSSVEAPAPSPLALVGATTPVPAALLTSKAGKSARALSLRVRSARSSRVHQVDPKLARGTTPSIIAAATSGKPAKPALTSKTARGSAPIKAKVSRKSAKAQ